MTVAAFMELALYDPECGYYARAAQRSGRAGDFFTSVDVGPLFGELLAIQFQEMASLLHESRRPESPHQPEPRIPHPESRHLPPIDLVDAGAGNGRWSADILAAIRERDAALFRATRLQLIEASAAARGAQAATLGAAAERLVRSDANLPESFEGVLIANELLDAMPVHQVVMRDDGLHEIFVGRGDPERAALHLIEGPPSTPALQAYLDRLGVRLERGFRAEINLRAVEWMRDAARRLRRGFMIVIDYGHEARELYSASHSGGTLTTFRGHRGSGPDETRGPAWLANPGEQDITAHVDFTSIRAAAEAEGLETIAFLDQTYFLLGLFHTLSAASEGERPTERTANASASAEAAAGRSAERGSAKASAERWSAKASAERGSAKASAERQLKTLIMPGGLGSTMKVLILGKGVGQPRLKGCSFKVRVT